MSCTDFYSRFRIIQTGVNSNNHKYLACSGFEIYGDVKQTNQTPLDLRENSFVARYWKQQSLVSKHVSPDNQTSCNAGCQLYDNLTKFQSVLIDNGFNGEYMIKLNTKEAQNFIMVLASEFMTEETVKPMFELYEEANKILNPRCIQYKSAKTIANLLYHFPLHKLLDHIRYMNTDNTMILFIQLNQRTLLRKPLDGHPVRLIRYIQ